MTNKTKKHIHNWQFDKKEWAYVNDWESVNVAYFYCVCGKAKRVMVEEVKK